MKTYFCSVGVGVGGLSSANYKCPQIELWNSTNQWNFCQFVHCQVTSAHAWSPSI